MADGTETWRPVPAWDGYQVSSLGRVRSPRGLLAQRADGHGYMTVTLRDGKRRKTARVHVLVAAVFLPRPLPGQTQVRHLNGRQWDNRAGNLAWGSQADNEADKARSLRAGARRRDLKRTETRFTTEYETSRDGAPSPQLSDGTLPPGQTPVSPQDETGRETDPATGFATARSAL